MKVYDQDVDVYFGVVSDAVPNWRELPDTDTPDDVDPEDTPPDVVAMLGFDPRGSKTETS